VKISLLLEKTNRRTLACVNDSDARLWYTRGVDFPHAVKLRDVVISFLQHLLRSVEAGSVDNNALGKMSIIRRRIGTHGTVKKRVDVGGMLLTIHVLETAGKELACIMRVRGDTSEWAGSVDGYLKAI
jgi:hypothetical protein